jgi:hypothetical protein
MLRDEGGDQVETIAVPLLPNGADRRIEEPDPAIAPF